MNPPPSSQPASEPARLDEAVLARLHDLDPGGQFGVVRRVLEAYETSVQRLLDQLAGDPDQVSTETLASLAHTLKSSSASIGALRMARACEDIERRARDGTIGSPRPEVERLRAEAEAARAAVAAALRP
jgi:hypothetical protein